MTIRITINGSFVLIDRNVFEVLLENSVARNYNDYNSALEKGSLQFSKLLELARWGEIPASLFFAPISVVQKQVELKTQKLLQGVSKSTFSLGTRSQVQLQDIELIVKDLLRKQELLKKHDSTLEKNGIVGLLHKKSRNIEGDAANLRDAIELSTSKLHQLRTKTQALEYFIQTLESKQVLVSRSSQNFMPQRLNFVKFSGLAVKDKKVPYIFLAGGDHEDYQEPIGRQIFTLSLMTTLIAKGIFSPMTWDASNIQPSNGDVYDIAGAVLMPQEIMKTYSYDSLDQVKELSDMHKVTPSAIVVRALRLSLLSSESATNFLDRLRNDFGQLSSSGFFHQPKPANAVRKYAGNELVNRMLSVLDNGGISAREFCRSICLNHIQPHQISNLR